MPLTTNDLYRAAEKGETSWEHALLLTGLLYVDAAGLVVSPPPADETECRFYKLRFDVLKKYCSDNHNYKKVINLLQRYELSIMP